RDALERMKRADILLLLFTPRRRVGVPAKLFEYLGAGRPILALTEEDADVAWVLRASGVSHRIAPPLDAGRIKQALAELSREIADGKVTAPATEQSFQFTRERMARDLATVLDRAVQRCAAPAAVPMPSLAGVTG